jgi:oligopeptide transport system substrate-binding protein
MPRFLIPLALAVAVVIAAAAVTLRTGGPPADLVWTAGPEVKTLDPAQITLLTDARVAEALFEGLVVQDPRDLAVRPGVAERWEISPDGLTYTFHLREDARWSDGRPVTADDFAWAWRRVLDPKTAAEYVYMLYPIRGAKAYYEAAAEAAAHDLTPQRQTGAARSDWSQVGVRVEGPRRLVVELERPTAYFLDLAAFTTYLPVRRDNVESSGDRWTMPPSLISNGAYRLAEWRFRSRMIWEKNPFYWNAGAVALGRIEVRVFADDKTALLAYETGAVDLTTVVPALAIQPLLEARDAGRRRDVVYATNFGTYFYRFNCNDPVLSDVRLRRALALAIDRRAIVERAARGGQVPTGTFVPVGLPGYASPPGLDENVQEARRLLAEAGHPGGVGLEDLSILVNSGFVHKPIAELVQQQWSEALGVTVRIEEVETTSFFDKVRKGEYRIARGGWYGDYLDPNTFLDCFVTGGGNNQTGWSNDEYDALVEEAARLADPAERMRVLARAEEILLREVPVVPMYVYTNLTLVRPGLEGVYPNLMNRIDFALLRWADRGPQGGAPSVPGPR